MNETVLITNSKNI